VPKILGDSLADHRDQVRQRLFAALRGLIVDRGYDAITLADVAAAAGVGRTAVYNHFADKESVLLAWVNDETDRYLVSLRAQLAIDDDPLGQLRTFIRMQITEFATHHTRLAGIGTALSADGRRAVREHVAPIIRILEDIVQRAIDSGIVPPQKIDTAVPMISALTAVPFAVVAKDDDLQAAIETVTEFVLHGIGAP
jgi:AcrR family transcriptional regulator